MEQWSTPRAWNFDSHVELPLATSLHPRTGCQSSVSCSLASWVSPRLPLPVTAQLSSARDGDQIMLVAGRGIAFCSGDLREGTWRVKVKHTQPVVSQQGTVVAITAQGWQCHNAFAGYLARGNLLPTLASRYQMHPGAEATTPRGLPVGHGWGSRPVEGGINFPVPSGGHNTSAPRWRDSKPSSWLIEPIPSCGAETRGACEVVDFVLQVSPCPREWHSIANKKASWQMQRETMDERQQFYILELWMTLFFPALWTRNPTFSFCTGPHTLYTQPYKESSFVSPYFLSTTLLFPWPK